MVKELVGQVRVGCRTVNGELYPEDPLSCLNGPVGQSEAPPASKRMVEFRRKNIHLDIVTGKDEEGDEHRLDLFD